MPQWSDRSFRCVGMAHQRTAHSSECCGACMLAASPRFRALPSPILGVAIRGEVTFARARVRQRRSASKNCKAHIDERTPDPATWTPRLPPARRPARSGLHQVTCSTFRPGGVRSGSGRPSASADRQCGGGCAKTGGPAPVGRLGTRNRRRPQRCHNYVSGRHGGDTATASAKEARSAASRGRADAIKIGSMKGHH